MAWSSDGKTIVIGNRNDKVVWVDVEEQTISRQIDMGKDVSAVPSLAAPDQHLVRALSSSRLLTYSVPHAANERIPLFA